MDLEMEPQKQSLPPAPPQQLSKCSKKPTETHVSLSGTSSHPMFLGAMISAEELKAVNAFFNPAEVPKNPTFYGARPSFKTKKQFDTVVSPALLGCAEVHAETNHPLYGEIAGHMAQRLPLSVMQNMLAGSS